MSAPRIIVMLSVLLGIAVSDVRAQIDPPMRFVGPYNRQCFGDFFDLPDPNFCFPDLPVPELGAGFDIDVQTFVIVQVFGTPDLDYDGIIGQRSPNSPFQIASGGSTDTGLVGSNAQGVMGISPVGARSQGGGMLLYTIELSLDVVIDGEAFDNSNPDIQYSREYNADITAFGEVEFDGPTQIVSRSGDVTLFSQFNVGDTVPAGIHDFQSQELAIEGTSPLDIDIVENLTASITFGVEDCNNNGIPDSSEADTDSNGIIDDCEPVQNLTQGTGYASLQNAINLADPYDEILIRAGTINEWFVTLGKTLTVRGEGIGNTIIDANAQTIGFDIFDSSASFSDITFRNASVAGGFIGGNVFLRNNTDVTFERCEFVDAFCEGPGAAFSLIDNCSVTFRDCTFANNRAQTDGGAIWMAGERTSASFENCTFQNNTADLWGGALMIRGSATASFDGCTFDSNEATAESGGHMAIYDNASVTMDRCIMLRGNAAIAGGSIDMQGSSTLDASNTLFARAVSQGGAALGMLGANTATLTNCTAAGNIAFDTLVLAQPTDTLIATNCIFWGNLTTFNGPVGSGVNGMTTINSCIFPEATGGTNIAMDPLFVSLASDNFSIGAGSPAIDAGSNPNLGQSPSAFDVAGNLRFTNDPSVDDTGVPYAIAPQSGFPIVDIGAFEFDGNQVACPERCPADVNGDGSATPADFTAWLAAFNVGCP